eukprot:GHRR01032293.1.p1 GENE.GHRR01032293.1~~GHRR01032293.1.p1  ORF type:complete len:123 (+),score=5.22 GHRR01032293.1:359-727(+)
MRNNSVWTAMHMHANKLTCILRSKMCALDTTLHTQCTMHRTASNTDNYRLLAVETCCIFTYLFERIIAAWAAKWMQHGEPRMIQFEQTLTTALHEGSVMTVTGVENRCQSSLAIQSIISTSM